jgi:septum formation protein
MRLYLASQSPRRAQLLAQIGEPHALLLPEPGEDAEALEAAHAGEPPLAYVQRVTDAKLAAALARHARLALPAGLVLAADTTVALGERILGKPQDVDEAQALLRALAGQAHQVHTAVAIAAPGGAVHRAVSTSTVWVSDIPDDALQAYVASGEPFGKAGAYGIQGRFAAWVSRIDGSHSGIMGLPLFETAHLLRAARGGGLDD